MRGVGYVLFVLDYTRPPEERAREPVQAEQHPVGNAPQLAAP